MPALLLKTTLEEYNEVGRQRPKTSLTLSKAYSDYIKQSKIIQPTANFVLQAVSEANSTLVTLAVKADGPFLLEAYSSLNGSGVSFFAILCDDLVVLTDNRIKSIKITNQQATKTIQTVIKIYNMKGTV